MEKLCIRGGGSLGRKALASLKKMDIQKEVVYFTDKDTGKYGSQINGVLVVDVNRAVSLYREGSIDKFIIIFEYGIRLIKDLVAELRTQLVEEKDILILYGEILEPFGKVKELLKFQFIDFQGMQDIQNTYLAASCAIKMQKSENLVVCGTNWLSQYLTENVLAKTVLWDELDTVDERKIYIICEEGYELKEKLREIPDSQKIYLYNIVFYYYFSTALWFDTLYSQKKKKNIYGIATGISTIREAIKSDHILNLANSAQDLFYDYRLLIKYGEKLKGKIQFAIMGLGPLALCYDLTVNKRTRNIALLYYPETKCLHNIEQSEFYIRYYDREMQKINFHLAGFSVERCFDDYYWIKKKKIFDLGNVEFSEDKLSERNKSIILEEMNRLFYESKNDCTIEENKENIIKYLTFCKGNGIQTIVFYPPYSHFYKKNIDYTLFKEVKDFIDSYQNEFQIKILDLSELDLTDDYFYDYIHLNKKGTRLVKSYIDVFMQEINQWGIEGN